MLESLRHEDFAAQLNTKFNVRLENEEFEVELIEVSPLKTRPRQESFSLFFQMPTNFPVQQGNFSFKNENIGETDIFIVPIEQDSDGTIFEAVFNRVIKKS